MSNKKKTSGVEMREIRFFCRQLGKARGRISRKYSDEILFEIKSFKENPLNNTHENSISVGSALETTNT